MIQTERGWLSILIVIMIIIAILTGCVPKADYEDIECNQYWKITSVSDICQVDLPAHTCFIYDGYKKGGIWCERK